ncbi:MAG: hypothetical protein M0P49_05835 [Bacilli bacterium]|nr:hypothetical protein [Bacilli bacterium]
MRPMEFDIQRYGGKEYAMQNNTIVYAGENPTGEQNKEFEEKGYHYAGGGYYIKAKEKDHLCEEVKQECPHCGCKMFYASKYVNGKLECMSCSYIF